MFCLATVASLTLRREAKLLVGGDRQSPAIYVPSPALPNAVHKELTGGVATTA
jgi:hypothetical protein